MRFFEVLVEVSFRVIPLYLILQVKFLCSKFFSSKVFCTSLFYSYSTVILQFSAVILQLFRSYSAVILQLLFSNCRSSLVCFLGCLPAKFAVLTRIVKLIVYRIPVRFVLSFWRRSAEQKGGPVKSKVKLETG